LGKWHISKAALTVRSGGVIAYPTEGVYGLGCSPWYAPAVFRILAFKRRPVRKGLIVIAAHMEQLLTLVEFSGNIDAGELQATWPGPVTWILPAKKHAPYWLTGNHRGIAVRVSDHPGVRALCVRAGPLISTSANPARARPARTPARVRSYFGNRVDYILPGRVGDLTGPTEIRNAITGTLIRSGG
jgi:L-threonylcarbamoyladenylate synthase